jgi:hypothetical protein
MARFSGRRTEADRIRKERLRGKRRSVGLIVTQKDSDLGPSLFHQFSETREVVFCVMRPRRSFGVILHGDYR